MAARPVAAEIHALQRDYLNQPAWQEAIAFVIETLTAEGAAGIAAALVRWMMPVDLVRAAELVNVGGAAVWAVVRDEFSRALRAWHDLGDVHRDCALAAMLATGQPDFADLVWPHLETNEQAMFRMCRLHEPFRLAVLGAGAVDRLARCPVKVETMFLREISRDATDDEIAYAEARARLGPPSVRIAALRLLVEQGRFVRVLAILFANDFGEWGEGIYGEVFPYIPTALLMPHTAAVRAKFDASESRPLRGGLVEFLRRVEHPDWLELAKAELNRAAADLRDAPMFPPTAREASLRMIAHYTRMLWRTQKDWMASWLVETFGAELPEPLSRWLEEFPEDALVAVATRIVAAPHANNRGSGLVDRLLASGSLRVARVFVDAYVAATFAGEDPLHLPRPEEVQRQSLAVSHILIDAILAKAETVTDFSQLRALIGAISPVSAHDGSLGAQIEPAQRDRLRALVVRTSEAIPSDDIARSYHARDIFALLAHSPASEAAELLLEYSNSVPLRGGAFSELLDALAMSPDTRCHARLLELLHVPEEELPGGNRSNLYRCILQVAGADAAFRVQLTEAIRRGTVQWQQSPHFGPDIGNAELLESMLGGTDLRPVEGELRQLISELAETHEPAGGGAYYIFPADATTTKRRLAQILVGGGTNAEVASRLLASLRLKRVERGQPAKEPLHPDVSQLESGAVFWPVRIV